MSAREALILRLDAAIFRLEQAISEPAMGEYVVERALADLRECRQIITALKGGGE